MDIIEVDPADRQRVRQFLSFPFRLYANTPQWVPPLLVDARKVFDRARYPFYRTGEAAFFLAMDRAGGTLGRIAVLENRKFNDFNRKKLAFFYLFECTPESTASGALFEAAFSWARQRGLDTIVGPKGFTIFDGMGFLVRGFEHRPAFGLPYNPPYYPSLAEAAGFEVYSELVSGYMEAGMEFPNAIHRLAEKLQERRGLVVHRFRSRRELRAILPQLKDLFNSTLTGTEDNAPLSDEEVQALANQMLWFADPRLIKIVMKGEQAVGFLFAYPDISAALQRTGGRIFPLGWFHLLRELRRTKWININGAGMMEGYRGLGGTALLFSEMYKSVQETGYQYADIVQIGVENERMQREMRNFGIDFYKQHAIFTRKLD